jgi:peptidoglycan/xylan/chitin deacetylase (PgdA/CDA1 family)
VALAVLKAQRVVAGQERVDARAAQPQEAAGVAAQVAVPGVEQRDAPAEEHEVATEQHTRPTGADAGAMQAAGWEIASHGLKWIDYRDHSREAEQADLEEAIRLHTEVTGERPLGWYTGRTSPNTRRLVVEDGGFVYDADDYNDDLPWYDMRYGKAQLIVPYTLDANDMRFATAQGFNSGDQFYAYLKDAFDVLYDEGTRTPRMMSVGLHCRLVGRPGRLASLERFLKYVRGKKVWFARRIDIARHWLKHHPHV